MKMARLEFAALLFRLPFFVGGGTVQSRNRNVVEPEIDAQLRRMVNQVIEAQQAEGRRARNIGDDVLAKAELEECGQVLVAGTYNGGPALGGRFLQALQAGFTRGKGKIGFRTLTVRHIHSVVLEDVEPKHRQRCTMDCQLTQLH
jgi:hypothetical protein